MGICRRTEPIGVRRAEPELQIRRPESAKESRAARTSARNPRKQIHRLHRQVERLESEKSQLQARAGQLRQQIKEQAQAIDQTQAEMTNTKAELDAIQERLFDVGRTLTRRHKKLVSRVGEEMTGMRRKASGCTKKIDEVEQRVLRRLGRSVAGIAVEQADKAKALAAKTINGAHASIENREGPTPELSSVEIQRSNSEFEAQPSELPDLPQWLHEQLSELQAVEGLEKEDLVEAAKNLEPETHAFEACERDYEETKTQSEQTKAHLVQLRAQYREQVSTQESLQNELLSVELQLALIQSQIDCINSIIESMKREQEQAEKDARRRDEELAIREVEERAARQAAASQRRHEESVRRAEQVKQCAQRLQFHQTKAFYRESQIELDRIQSQTRQIDALIEEALAKSAQETRQAEKANDQIDRVDAHFGVIIDYLKTLVTTSKGQDAIYASVPSGVRMTGELAVALNELLSLKSLITETKDGDYDDIVSAHQRQARQSTLDKINQGLIPEPRDLKCLAVNTNAPKEWVKQLDGWSQQLEELSSGLVKHGKLKGLLEQRKMTVLSQFVDFLQELGAENFKALLTGSSLSFSLPDLQDQNSSRRKHLDSVLDGLFCT